MHDPLTVAFEIRSPFRSRPSKFWPKGYRSSVVTVWHCDPECDGSDDSCGWFHPPMKRAERDRVHKMGRQEFSSLFGKRWATIEQKDYVSACYEPSVHDAIYWAWRQIKYEGSRYVWKFGRERRALTQDELERIYELGSNPVDNLRVTFSSVVDEETCGDFFVTVYRCYKRFNRHWYKHPRWHFWHWSFQIHTWQTFRRWALSRCAKCGQRFSWGYSPVSHSWESKKPGFLCGEEGVYHSECSGISDPVKPA